jgi:hypothetical protein
METSENSKQARSIVSDVGYEVNESTGEDLEDKREKWGMANARTYKAGTYYFDEYDELIGREMSEKEIKSPSRDKLLEAANGDWQSNGQLYGLRVLEGPDGKLITYAHVDIFNQDGIAYESRFVEVNEGEDLKAAFKKEYKDRRW